MPIYVLQCPVIFLSVNINNHRSQYWLCVQDTQCSAQYRQPSSLTYIPPRRPRPATRCKKPQQAVQAVRGGPGRRAAVHLAVARAACSHTSLRAVVGAQFGGSWGLQTCEGWSEWRVQYLLQCLLLVGNT